MTHKVYQMVTDRILKQLEQVDPSDYSKPWFDIGLSPINIESKKAYRGINHLTLAGHETNLFGTFKQWQKHDCKVKKGEKASPVVKWTFFEGDEESEKAGKVTGVSIRYFNVFNSSQVEGDYARALETKALKELKQHDTDAECEALVTGYIKNELLKVKPSDRACYAQTMLGGEWLEMPNLGQFKKPEDYYSVFFHEMTHSTGNAKRLKRDLSGKFGSSDYAFEELIAELGASFLMAETGGQMTPRKDHAQYLAGWIRKLKSDPKYIVMAAQKAQKAADYINEAAANYHEYLAKKDAA